MNYTEKIKAAKDRGRKALEAAKAATDPAERDRHLADAKAAVDEAKGLQHDAQIIGEAKSLADDLGTIGGDTGKAGKAAIGVPLATKAGRDLTAKRLVDKIHTRDVYGQKASTIAPSGSALVPVAGPDEITATARPVRLLEALPYAVTSSPVWRYARQTARTNRAAIVPAGEVKPESDYGVEVLDNGLEVFAHLLSGVDKYVLSDSDALQRFLADEMAAGLLDAVEREVVAGNGTDGHLEGLLNVSGAVVQAFDTDPLTTLRMALAVGEVAGHRHDLIVLNPLDHARLELQRAPGSGEFDLGTSPVDRAERRVWGTPTVTAASVPQGTAIVLERGAVAVRSDGRLETTYSDAAGFDRNEVSIRCEERFALDVYRPAAITVAELTAATP
ncbi:phage major capsid protein [Rhodococcus aetherivorans]|uniref:phage major capsid protein n=1 Tax=Rhodococcus aetherivorans TaxID=191292 RepID=UPI00294A96CC|nr:phage major capsid protein [Rhodococcus aetherivorans]MDV6291657.1 phage major capsid protein [Rhodococcus aetherivorans]